MGKNKSNSIQYNPKTAVITAIKHNVINTFLNLLIS
jgi:hypothetical protein